MFEAEANLAGSGDTQKVVEMFMKPWNKERLSVLRDAR